MLVCCIGAEGLTCQVQRIREGFEELGHENVSINEAELIYINDLGSYNSSIDCNKNAIKIINILDIPEHLPEYGRHVETIKRLHASSYHVTCISKTTKEQIGRLCNIDATVIYNPAKDVAYEPHLKNYVDENVPKFLYIGRANDVNKRFSYSSIIVNKYAEMTGCSNKILVVGSERPAALNIAYAGVVDDSVLNVLYNHCEIVFLPSKFEGIGLSMIEALICRKFPVVWDDNPAAHEFMPQELICNGDNVIHLVDTWMSKTGNDYEKMKILIDEYGERYALQFNKRTIAQNILNSLAF
jgi:glycosyltransferase involved in cell wall biosynthesis